MAIGIYLYCYRHFYVQKVICHSKLELQGEGFQSEML